MLKITTIPRTDKEKRAFVNECEQRFEAELDNVCKTLCEHPELKIIALSGPTCSGKTTTAKKLISELSGIGRDVHLISIDDFFKERDVLNRAAEMNANTGLDYDSINAIDLDSLKLCTDTILKCDPTELPRYDFKTGKRVVCETVDPEDNSIFIFEGIQAIYPEVTSLFSDAYTSLYIGVEDDLEMNGVFFTKRDLRLMRRLVRDFKFRGAEPQFTFYLWRSVVQNEKVSIEPYVDSVKLRINSVMPYELMLLKNDLTEILARVPETDRFYAKALEITEKLKGFGTIDYSLVPEESLMHEFIG